MQLLLDNVVASIIGVTVFLIIVSLTMWKNETSVDTTNHYALKSQELTFIDILKQDLQSVTAVYDVTETVTDSSFRFRTQLSPPDTATGIVTYRRKRVGERDGVPFFQIERYVGSNRSGASMVTVTDWTIEVRNANGNKVAKPNIDLGEQIYVRFEAAAPFREDKIVRLSRWESTFRPPMLRPVKVLL